jgi:predicted nucleic acid-binding protein
MKIVLDTNCLVSIIMPDSYNNDVWQAFRNAKYVLCITNEILFAGKFE